MAAARPARAVQHDGVRGKLNARGRRFAVLSASLWFPEAKLSSPELI